MDSYYGDCTLTVDETQTAKALFLSGIYTTCSLTDSEEGFDTPAPSGGFWLIWVAVSRFMWGVPITCYG